MFDFHIHSTVSYDAQGSPKKMLRQAEKLGLREICFTDHMDYVPNRPEEKLTFDPDTYGRAYDGLSSQAVKVRLGMEFGMLPDNRDAFARDASQRDYDFIIGSVHCVGGVDIYYPEYWQDLTVPEAELRYLQEVLTCVRVHDGFDVLGHLTYITKLKRHPTHTPIQLETYKALVDEIFRVLIQKGIGIEVNTSGVDSCGAFLPDRAFLARFKELGGQIVTVGSDAHGPDRLGQYCSEACRMVQEIFGYICTFENRQPIFHKL